MLPMEIILPLLRTPLSFMSAMAALSGPQWSILVKSDYGVLGGKGRSLHKNYQKYVTDATHGDNIAPVGGHFVLVLPQRVSSAMLGSNKKNLFLPSCRGIQKTLWQVKVEKLICSGWGCRWPFVKVEFWAHFFWESEYGNLKGFKNEHISHKSVNSNGQLLWV